MQKNEPTSIPTFPNCFVCGQDNPYGLQLKFSLHKGKSKTTFKGEKTHLGYENMVHGGIISAILDDAIIWALYAAKETFGLTAELKVRFLKPVPINKEFIIQGEILEDKGKLLIGKSTLKDKNDKIYAKARAKIVLLK